MARKKNAVIAFTGGALVAMPLGVKQNNKIMKNNISLFILLTVGFVGCSEKCFNEPDISKNAIVPLEIENVWNYHISVFNKDSIIFREYDKQNKIIIDTVVNNERWFLTTAESSTVDSFWCVNRDDGYWVKPVYDDTLSFNVIPVMQYKYPCKVGDIFKGVVGSDWEVISVDTVIEVHSSTVKCILFRTRTYYNLQSSYEEDFVAVSIGLVLIRSYNRLANGDPYLFYHQELTSFEIIGD